MKRILASVLLSAALLAPAASTAFANDTATLARVADEAAIMRVATEIEVAVDRKDWVAARSHFADDIRVDFTSLVGGEPANIKADDLIAGWSSNLKGNKESLHIRGGELITIEGDTATMHSNGYAWNKLPGATDGAGDLWEVWGNYIHVMKKTESGWKVVDFTFNMTHERGSMWVKATPGV
jgi:ketosteroid isomerase-like protein